MKLYYITLNNIQEAKALSRDLIQKRLAVCTNWFPIGCMYRSEDEIKEGDEVVLIVKTKSDLRTAIEKIIAEHISYTNFIGEVNVESVNRNFLTWLDKDVSQ